MDDMIVVKDVCKTYVLFEDIAMGIYAQRISEQT